MTTVAGLNDHRTRQSLASALAYQLRPPAWHRLAACRGMTPAESDRAFYPNGGQPSLATRAMCAACPVRQQCIDAGDGQPGVWGGLTEPERARARTA